MPPEGDFEREFESRSREMSDRNRSDPGAVLAVRDFKSRERNLMHELTAVGQELERGAVLPQQWGVR